MYFVAGVKTLVFILQFICHHTLRKLVQILDTLSDKPFHTKIFDIVKPISGHEYMC